MITPAVLSVAVQTEDFSLEDAFRRLRQAAPGAGAEVAFVGLVRDQAGSVASLTLEHYPGMSERSMLAVCERAAKRWPLQAVEAIHRVGTLGPGDQIVLVLVSSAHRHAASHPTALSNHDALSHIGRPHITNHEVPAIGSRAT